MDIKTAIQTMIETKLIGTWRLAVILQSEPDKIYVTKNAGPLYMGKSAESVVICNDSLILNEQADKFAFRKLKSNIIYEISEDCTIVET